MMLFEKLSNNIGSLIGDTLNFDKSKKEVIAYGAYIFLDTILAISMVALFGIIFDVLLESLVVSFSAALLRKTSGGAHATTSARCVFIGTIVAVGFALLIESIKPFISLLTIIFYMIVTYIISYFLILKLAPKDSANKPIVKESKIKELKAKSIRTLFIYFIICILILTFGYYFKIQHLYTYIALICTGTLWQSFTLTSLGHSVTNIMEMPFDIFKNIGGENK